MKIAVFSTKSYDRRFLEEANSAFHHDLTFLEARLSPETVALAEGHGAVCVFVNDVLDATVLRKLRAGGTRLVALRCSGFNNVDVTAAEEAGMVVVRVPAYSPNAVAEHTVTLMLALNRKIHKAYNRVREGNMALEGLLGFDLSGRTVGIVGTGRIGTEVARIMRGFGCVVVAHDVYPNQACRGLGVEYVSLDELLRRSDVVTLHCPLVPETHHLINGAALDAMKPGVMLINTSRGAVIDTGAVVQALKSGKIGYLGLDVYEEEADLFFEDLSDTIIQDDVFTRLLTFPNVLVTAHQAFFTQEALANIAQTTLENVAVEASGLASPHRVTSAMVVHS